MSEPPAAGSRSQRCDRCKGTFPATYDACPYCGAAATPPSALGSWAERLLPRDRPMTKLAIGLCVMSFGLIALLAGPGAIMSPSTYTLIHFGAMFPPYLVEGQWWRLVTALFLHGGLLHLGFNSYALWQVGPLIEGSFGRSRFLSAFILTGIASTLCSFAWGFVAFDVASAIPIPFLFNPATAAGFATPSVGMSGALTGLVGLAAAAGHKVHNSQGRLIRNAMLRWMGGIAVFGLLMPGIDNAAHLGGFLAGVGLGFVLPLKGEGSAVKRRLWGAVAAVCAVIAIGSVLLQGWSIPKDAPADLEAYPQGVFGVVVRDGDTEDTQIEDAWNACESSFRRLSIHDATLEPSARDIEQAVATCDEARAFRPMEPSAYAWAAAAHEAAGDHAGACARLRSGRLLLEQHYAKRAAPRQRATVEALRQRFELVEAQVPCGDASR